MKSKKLAVNIPSINDCTSFYRAANPLAQIANSYPGLYWNPLTYWNDAHCRCHDAAFLQRPCTAEHRGMMQLALEAGLKVWVDYDDLVTDVPTSNPTYFQYAGKDIKETIKWCVNNATVITTSTAHLATRLAQMGGKNIIVVPNALDTRLASVRDRGTPGPREKVVAWRGTPTHLRDIMSYALPIMNVSRDESVAKEWRWHFIGDTAWIVSDSMPHLNTYITHPMGPMEYHRHIQSLRPSLMQVPLHTSDFNMCKSNIAWIEGSFAGAATLAPNWHEWKMPGVLNYENEEQYANHLYAVIKGEVDVVDLAKQGWEYIMENLRLEKVNEARVDVLCQLFDCNRGELR